ncbi:MAG: hypothetical protein WCA08_24845 [Desulfoferrobacter sp.]
MDVNSSVDGELIVSVIQDGEPRLNSNGDYMTIEEAVAEMSEEPEYRHWFRKRQQARAQSRANRSRSKPVMKGPNSRLTEQRRLKKEKPKLAERLKAAPKQKDQTTILDDDFDIGAAIISALRD